MLSSTTIVFFICCMYGLSAFTPPPRPAVFHTIEEFKAYMQALTNYYNIAQRSRFGRSIGGLKPIAVDAQPPETQIPSHPVEI